MADFQNTIDLLGDDVITKAFLDNTLTEFHDDIVNNVRDYAFYNCSKLKSIIAPNATSVGLSAFDHAGLETADLPNVTTIGNSGFDGCKQLRTINIPLAEYIGSYAFKGCIALAALDLPNVTAVIYSAFQGCKALVSVNLPRATRIDNSAFYGCTSLVSVNIPSFRPSFNPTSLFYGCSSLPNVDLPQGVPKIVTTMFKDCAVLKTLILRRESVCTLSATDAFDGTPFASGGTGGKVLVPRALIESYETATNWSTLYAAGTCTFLAIEDYTLDGTITGEIDWASMSVARSLVQRTIRSIDSEAITSTGESAFRYCRNMTSVNLPKLTSIGMASFEGCTNLVNVDLGSAKTISTNCFASCSSLESVDFPYVKTLGSGAFQYCNNLKTVILRSSTLCTLSSTGALSGTLFASGKAGGTLLVPRSLTASYTSATNWSSIMSANANNRILALEDYTVDGTITGEIDWDKLNASA